MNGPILRGWFGDTVARRAAELMCEVHGHKAAGCVVVMRPEAITRLALEDLWETHGTGTLRVVARDDGERVRTLLERASLAHRPDVTCPQPESFEQALHEVLTRLVRGDVLVLVADDERGASTLLADVARRGWQIEPTLTAVAGPRPAGP